MVTYSLLLCMHPEWTLLCIERVSECLRKVHLAMLLRMLRKSVCVIGTGGS